MPRITLLRILGFIPLAWLCLIFAWLFLPSPQIPRAFRDNHIQQTLGSGQVITTVLDWDAPLGECASYAVDWNLVSNKRDDSVTLRVGKARINLTDLVLHDVPYLSPRINAGVRSGDLDHIINMPWFDYADANLFHHQMHGFPGDLHLRALVLNSQEVQIWKDAASWKTFKNPATLDDERRAVGLLATFAKVQNVKGARASISGIRVSDVKGRLTSNTYHIRSTILEIIAPTLMILLVLLEFAVLPAAWYMLACIGPVIAAYVVIVLTFWFRSGRPPFREWSSKSLFTRGLLARSTKERQRKKTWGPSGPILDNSDVESDQSLGSSYAMAGKDKASHRWIGKAGMESV